eukprot:COSAG02_NODE_1555_length_11948_cov_28.444932_5_plen_110_part_00
MGRIVLEGLCPMLELSMIVSLTYDRRRSWTARFCNTRPIRLLGDISMSFYMTHMLAYMFFTAVGYPYAIAQSRHAWHRPPHSTLKYLAIKCCTPSLSPEVFVRAPFVRR